MPERHPDLVRRELLIKWGMRGLGLAALGSVAAVAADVIHNKWLTNDADAHRAAFLNKWATASVDEHHDQSPAPIGVFSERLIRHVRDSTLITTVTFTKNGTTEAFLSTSFLTHPNTPLSVNNEAFFAMTAHGLTGASKYTVNDIDTFSVGRPHTDTQMHVFDKGSFTASVSSAYDGSGNSNLSHDVGLVRLHNTSAVAALTSQRLDYISNARYFHPGTQLLAVGYPSEVIGSDMPTKSQAYDNVATLLTAQDNIGYVNLVIDGGMSGAPLVNNAGEVVGMAVAAMDKVYDQGIIIGLQDLDALFANV